MRYYIQFSKQSNSLCHMSCFLILAFQWQLMDEDQVVDGRQHNKAEVRAEAWWGGLWRRCRQRWQLK